MPKRSKKLLDGPEKDGRPPELTLASFLSGSLCSSLRNLEPWTQQESSTGACVEPEKETNKTEPVEFSVKRTKKGKLPISYENRAKGKKVTVISNVEGDPTILLQELKKRIGAGGVARASSVEIQGDHQLLVTEFLTGHPCLKNFQD